MATGRGTPAPPHSAACHIQDSRSHILAHTRQSRPHSGIDKTVTARLWHVQDSHGQIMARTRQSRPDSSKYKTARGSFSGGKGDARESVAGGKCRSRFENKFFTEMCSGSEAGSHFRLVDFVYHSTPGLKVIKRKREGKCNLREHHQVPMQRLQNLGLRV